MAAFRRADLTSFAIAAFACGLVATQYVSRMRCFSDMLWPVIEAIWPGVEPASARLTTAVRRVSKKVLYRVVPKPSGGYSAAFG